VEPRKEEIKHGVKRAYQTNEEIKKTKIICKINPPVVHKDVRTLDIPVKEVPLMAIGEALCF
jgi:hypothetical protein